MKIKSKYIVYFLLLIVLVAQFIDIYYPSDLFFYGQLAVLGVLVLMLLNKSFNKK